MKLPKLLLGAMLVSIAATTASCNKKDEAKPAPQESPNPSDGSKPEEPWVCLACGMG